MTSFIDDEGNELEYDGKDFAVTKQIISFFDFKIKGNVSVNIKIQNTAYNRNILNYHSVNQIGSTIKKRFNVYTNGNKQMQGFLTITNVDSEDIEVFFLSGNANVFTLFDFPCNAISTTKYDVHYEFTFPASKQSIEDTWGRGYGITFPVIDWVFRGQYAQVTSVLGPQICELDLTSGDIGTVTAERANKVQGLIPCLYVHTLIDLLANHAGCNVTGTLLNDPFYKKLIITPETASRWGYSKEQNNASLVVKPEHIMSTIKAIDILKWLVVSFGCRLTFDEDSNTISIDLVDKLDNTDAEDWSDYYISHEIRIDKYYNFNSINWKTSTEENQKAYNEINDSNKYANLLIESDKNDSSKNTAYTAPFTPCYDIVGDAPFKWATPLVDMYNLSDGAEYTYTSVTSSVSGNAVLNGTFKGNGSQLGRVIFKIEDDNGIYSGYYADYTQNAGGTTLTLGSIFKGNSSGKVIFQTHSYNTPGHKILVCINTNVSSFLQYPTVVMSSPGASGVTVTSCDTAYFAKGYTIYQGLNDHTAGLAYGTINESNRTDLTMQDRYLKRYTKILQTPPYKCKMLIPEAVFAKYNFGLIYLKVKDFAGYFLVEEIQQYKDSQTPVVVYLRSVE